MAAHWVWWILGVALIGAELVSGTLYLFAVGAAFVVCGVVAWLGASTPVQLVVVAVLAIGGIFAAHKWRTRHAMPAPQPPLDVGQSVQVQVWNPDGTARVAYRGTHWNAELARPDAARAKTMYIVGTRGSTLVIAPERPTAA